MIMIDLLIIGYGHYRYSYANILKLYASITNHPNPPLKSWTSSREIRIVRIEILPQYMEALRADGRVRLSGLPRNETGLY
jgi:hypothetical protein